MDEILNYYSEKIRTILSGFNISKNVRSEIEYRDASSFDGCLTLGLPVVDESYVAKALALTKSSYQGLPLTSLIVPSTMEGSLWGDNTALGTDIFYILEEEEFIPIKTDNPVCLDGYFPLAEEISPFLLMKNSVVYSGPEQILLPPSRLRTWSESKLNAKKLFKKAGLPTPNYEVYSANAVISANAAIEPDEANFFEFVVKPDNGMAGMGVRFFQKRKDAVDYLKDRQGIYLIEERINPLEWIVDEQLQDWNVRALVTISNEPQWIGGFVRRSVKDKNRPVNIHQGAQYAGLESITKMRASPEKIKEISLETAKVVYREVGELGYAGIDLMESADGVFIIEVNCGAVGGFSTLTKLKKAPLMSFREAFARDLAPLLLENHLRRKEVPKIKLQNNCVHLRMVGWALVKNKKEADALCFFIEAIEKGADEQAYERAGYCLWSLNRLEEAKEMFQKALKINPDADYARESFETLNVYFNQLNGG